MPESCVAHPYYALSHKPLFALQTALLVALHLTGRPCRICVSGSGDFRVSLCVSLCVSLRVPHFSVMRYFISRYVCRYVCRLLCHKPRLPPTIQHPIKHSPISLVHFLVVIVDINIRNSNAEGVA